MMDPSPLRATVDMLRTRSASPRSPQRLKQRDLLAAACLSGAMLAMTEANLDITAPQRIAAQSIKAAAVAHVTLPDEMVAWADETLAEASATIAASDARIAGTTA